MLETQYSGYFVDEEGNVYSNKQGILKQLKPWLAGQNRYYYVNVGKKKEAVHRLVLETFIGKAPENMEANHINRISTDNRLENLEWVTRKRNIQHMYETDTPVRNFINTQVYKDGVLIQEFKSLKDACTFVSNTYRISYSMLSKHRSYNGFQIVTPNRERTDNHYGKHGGYQQVLLGRSRK